MGSELRDTANKRLLQERKAWRQDHPFGFVAKPREGSNGTVDMFTWDCTIPAKKDSKWQLPSSDSGYHLLVKFPDGYPGEPPKCSFDPPLFHPNIFPSGAVCLSILNGDKDYTPAISVKQILLGIQELLDTPNINDPAQREAYQMLKEDKERYWETVKKLSKSYKYTAPSK